MSIWLLISSCLTKKNPFFFFLFFFSELKLWVTTHFALRCSVPTGYSQLLHGDTRWYIRTSVILVYFWLKHPKNLLMIAAKQKYWLNLIICNWDFSLFFEWLHFNRNICVWIRNDYQSVLCTITVLICLHLENGLLIWKQEKKQEFATAATYIILFTNAKGCVSSGIRLSLWCAEFPSLPQYSIKERLELRHYIVCACVIPAEVRTSQLLWCSWNGKRGHRATSVPCMPWNSSPKGSWTPQQVSLVAGPTREGAEQPGCIMALWASRKHQARADL